MTKSHLHSPTFFLVLSRNTIQERGMLHIRAAHVCLERVALVAACEHWCAGTLEGGADSCVTWYAIVAGWEHSCAATLDAATLEPNRLVCWGNSEAKLGVADGFLLEPQGQCIGLCHHCQLSTAHPPPKPHAPARLLPLAFVLFVGGGRMRA